MQTNSYARAMTVMKPNDEMRAFTQVKPNEKMRRALSEILAGSGRISRQNALLSIQDGVAHSAVASWAIRFCRAIAHGLKIRVSAVRFCPWPLLRKYNVRAVIGALGRSVAARCRFLACRGNWRDVCEVCA